MKRRFLTFLLAIGLCLGVMTPVWASNALNPSAANAYFNVLTQQYQQENVVYTSLMDMNSDGNQDLLVVSRCTNGTHDVNVSIWQIKNGQAIRTSTMDCAPNEEGTLYYYRHGTQIYVCASTCYANVPVTSNYHNIIGADGLARWYHHSYEWSMSWEPEFTREIDGQKTQLTEEIYYKELENYGLLKGGELLDIELPPNYTEIATSMLNGELGIQYVWMANTSEYETYSDVRSQLQLAGITPEVEKPQIGTYSGMTISEYGLSPEDYQSLEFKLYLEQAMLQQKEIQHLTESDAGTNLETKTVKILYLKPGSKITITGNQPNGQTMESVRMCGNYYGTIQNGIYQEYVTGVPDGSLIYSGPVEQSFKAGQFLRVGGYYLQLADDHMIETVGDFMDVKKGDYYAAPVEWAVEHGITGGTSATTFSPNSTCTTAQIITFLWRAAGEPEPIGTAAFSDISVTDYYYQAALWAKEQGMVSGSVFQGNAPCTRADTVTYLWTLAGKPDAEPADFVDVPKNSDYAQAVSWAMAEGVTSGTSSQKFSPDNICTRGQIVTFLYRDMGR